MLEHELPKDICDTSMQIFMARQRANLDLKTASKLTGLTIGTLRAIESRKIEVIRSTAAKIIRIYNGEEAPLTSDQRQSRPVTFALDAYRKKWSHLLDKGDVEVE